MRSTWTVLLLAAAMPLSGQTATAPSLGWLQAGAEGEIRILEGIAGAAWLGQALQAGPARLLALHPARRLALAVTEEGRLTLLAQAGDAALAPVAEADAGAGIGFARFSPSGTALVTGSLREGRWAVWRLEPQALALEREFDIPAAGAAVSDDAQRVLVDNGEALLLMDAGGGMREVSRAALSYDFVARRGAFAVLEPGALGIEDGEGHWIRTPIGERASGAWVASPAPDTLLLVEPGEAQTRVSRYSASGGRLASREVPAHVVAVAATGEAGLLHLRSPESGPQWLVRVTADGLDVFFVPANTPERGEP